MIALGVDLGERRIGIATSDPLGITAQPLVTIERESLAQDVARVSELAAECEAQVIVVGLPLNMDGSVGPAARAARRFTNALRRKLGLTVELWDERLTTVEAEHSLIEAGFNFERKREVIDQVAAALILQSYLDAQHNR